jgi:hypothetical protein
MNIKKALINCLENVQQLLKTHLSTINISDHSQKSIQNNSSDINGETDLAFNIHSIVEIAQNNRFKFILSLLNAIIFFACFLHLMVYILQPSSSSKVDISNYCRMCTLQFTNQPISFIHLSNARYHSQDPYKHDFNIYNHQNNGYYTVPSVIDSRVIFEVPEHEISTFRQFQHSFLQSKSPFINVSQETLNNYNSYWNKPMILKCRKCL